MLRRNAPHRLHPALGAMLAVAAAGLLAPASVVAKPIVPGSTPLWVDVDERGMPATCPSPATIDGSEQLRVLRQLPEESQGLALLYTLGTGLPIVHWCDPEALQSRRLPGAIRGDVASDVTDGVFWGQRYLTGGSVDRGPEGLRVGDEVELPAGGPAAVLDLAVATGTTGTRTLRVPAGPSAPARVQVQGTATAPVLLVTAVDGTTRSVTVEPVRRPAIRVRSGERGGRPVVRIQAAAGSIVFLDGRGISPEPRFVARSGRLVVPIRASKRRARTIEVVVVDLVGRRQRAVRCVLRPAGRPATCTSAAAPRPGLGAPGDLPGLPSARTAATARTTSQLVTPRAMATRHATNVTAGAALVQRNRRGLTTLLTGDLTGDGFPDFLTLGFRTGKDPSATLLVSAGEMRWARVPLRGFSTDAQLATPVTADVTGDGRAELLASDGSLVTDAFAGGIPRSINLGRTRTPTDRDLIPPPDGALSLSTFSSLAQGVADVTGDRRPELVTSDESAAVVMPSEAFTLGRQARPAQVLPVFSASKADWDKAFEEIMLGLEDATLAEARTERSLKVVLGRMYRAAPRAGASRTIDLEERRADGSVVASRTFTASGFPVLLDVDPATGDAAVLMVGPAPCSASRPRAASCRATLLRVRADGTTSQPLAIERRRGIPDVVFTADGPDADLGPELVVHQQAGPLYLWRSSDAATTTVRQLPQVVIGRPALISGFEHVVLPNGSRWMSVDRARTINATESLVNDTVLIAPLG